LFKFHDLLRGSQISCRMSKNIAHAYCKRSLQYIISNTRWRDYHDTTLIYVQQNTKQNHLQIQGSISKLLIDSFIQSQNNVCIILIMFLIYIISLPYYMDGISSTIAQKCFLLKFRALARALVHIFSGINIGYY